MAVCAGSSPAEGAPARADRVTESGMDPVFVTQPSEPAEGATRTSRVGWAVETPGSAGGSAASAVHERARRGELRAGLEPRLQPGQDHRPAPVELLVDALPQLVVDECQPARVGHLLDLPH